MDWQQAGYLFDMDEFCPAESKKEQRIANARAAAPEGIALVYTATRAGKATAGHYFMRIEDAKKFCSHPKSKGVVHGNEWAFFWTSLKNYMGNFLDLTEYGIDFSGFCDNGSRDELLNELGICPLNFIEVCKDLELRGFKVKYPPHTAEEKLDAIWRRCAYDPDTDPCWCVDETIGQRKKRGRYE